MRPRTCVARSTGTLLGECQTAHLVCLPFPLLLFPANIVLFMGVTFNPYSIVTELLDTSLFAVLHQQRRVLTPQQQVHVALGVARGLASLHGHAVPIVHRDIKSLNSQNHTHATAESIGGVAGGIVCRLTAH